MPAKKGPVEVPGVYDKAIDAVPAAVPRWTVVKAAVLSAAFIFAYSAPIAFLFNDWREPDFSHGVLVPFVSLYFVWIERHRLRRIPVEPAFISGSALIIIAIFFLAVGRAGRLVTAEEASILILVPGLVLLVLGRAHLRALALPVAYLAFMVPLLNPVMDKVYWPFQIFTARSAAMLLPHLGVPVFRRMQFLDLPNISLEVAQGCSGFNFMMSVYAVAVPLAYFTQKGWAKKTALMVAAFMIGLLTNVVRVTLVGVWTYYNLGDAVHGPYHLLQGYFVSVVGFILLFITSMALSRFRFNRLPEAVKDDDAVQSGGPGHKTIMNAPFFMALAFLAGTGWYMHFFSITPVPPARPLDRIPLSIGEWRGKEISPLQSPVRMPGADSELARLYTKGSGREAMLYIGYVDVQKDGSELINDYFKDFYDGINEIAVPDLRGGMRLDEKIMRADGKKYLALFWYDLDGRAYTNRKFIKLAAAYDGLVRGRTNGAVIMIISRLEGREDLAGARHDEAMLAQEIRPILKDFFPAR